MNSPEAEMSLLKPLTFQIPYVQILDHLGQFNPEFNIKLPTKLLNTYYRIMTLMRLFDKKAISLQRTGRMGTYAPIYGQEAVGTVMGLCMQAEDVFIPYYRDYACLYQRGVELMRILQYWGGDERGSLFHPSSKDLPLCVPIASQCQHAVGIAYALKYKKSKQIALVTIGDGGSSEGDFYEAINAAGVWDLPLVIVIVNNQWAISVPRSKQSQCPSLAQKAIAAGIAGIQVDGNDVFALHQVLSTAIAEARGPQSKPCVIEAITYRLCDHTTADDASRYQPKDEVEQAQMLEPIQRLEKYLLEQQILTTTQIEEIHQACQAEVETQVQKYLQLSPPNITDMFDYHFANLPSYLIEQRATAIEEFKHAHD